MDDFNDFLWRLSRHLASMVGAEITFGGDREPFIEFTESDDEVLLTCEMPGVKAEDVRVRVCGDEFRVTIVENGVVTYSEDFETGRIKPAEARITYRNGVLEVRIPFKKALF
jgi:HSP20 family protein